jgi:hypothetical protein
VVTILVAAVAAAAAVVDTLVWMVVVAVVVDIACIVVDNLIEMVVVVAVDMNFDMVDMVGNFDFGNLAAVVLILNLEWIGEVARDLAAAAVVVLLAQVHVGSRQVCHCPSVIFSRLCFYLK